VGGVLFSCGFDRRRSPPRPARPPSDPRPARRYGVGGRRRVRGDVSARRRPTVPRPAVGRTAAAASASVVSASSGNGCGGWWGSGPVNKPWQLRFPPHSPMRYTRARVSRILLSFRVGSFNDIYTCYIYTYIHAYCNINTFAYKYKNNNT